MNVFFKHLFFWILFNACLGLLGAMLSLTAARPGFLLLHFLVHQLLFQSISLPSAASGYLTFYNLLGLYRRPLMTAILIANSICLPVSLMVSGAIGLLLEGLQPQLNFMAGLPFGWPLALGSVSLLITPIITSTATALVYLREKLEPSVRVVQALHGQLESRVAASTTAPVQSTASISRPPVAFTFKNEDCQRVVPYDSLNYLEARGHRTVVHTDGGVWVASGNLGQLAAQLPAERFLRIHKSVVVNLGRIAHIQYFMGGSYLAFLRDNEESCLRVGRSYVPALKGALGIQLK
ncbi:MAG: LytTR family transcriptional regulator DNA-binding domain-containing protein [Leptospiraceae bacterium]|nr:LytTR family transcriptional regulator DNA-binding domain-containing protein [Leptospiraceae bacterium]